MRVNNNNSGVKAGYYEQLYAGHSQVLKKVEKTVKSTSTPTGRERFFVPVHDVPDYYIKSGGTYYKVNSQGTVLDVFAGKKKELKQYIKDKHIQFDGLFEQSLELVAGYYDSLTN